MKAKRFQMDCAAIDIADEALYHLRRQPDAGAAIRDILLLAAMLGLHRGYKEGLKKGAEKPATIRRIKSA